MTWRRRSARLGFGSIGAMLFAGVLFATLEAIIPFPERLLNDDPASPRVTSREGVPLLATVARDDQWRVPVPLRAIDRRIVEATIAVEDERFHRHPGVDPGSIARALGQNISAGAVVSGASTITMQLCRMLEPRPRTLRSKGIEAFRALQLERILDKDEILEEYLNRAPYGGNLVGIEAAARRYFGKSADAVSLAEAALLAGLPQGPAILRPDRHPERAERRRRTVLERMRVEGFISRDECARALTEPIALARPGDGGHGLSPASHGLAPHAAWWVLGRDPNGGRTTIDATMQRALLETLERVAGLPEAVEVAAVVIEIETGAVRALVGSRDFHDLDAGWVSGATARRSPGSTLKPFIYARAFADGVLAPESAIPDHAIERAGWRPQNFDGQWRGTVSAREALLDSLNVPAILVAEGVGLGPVLATVEGCGIRLPRDPARRGGLAVVTGALEVTLVDLVNGYATLGRRGRFLPATIWEAESERRGAVGAEGTPVLPAFACLEVDAILGVSMSAAPDAPWWMAKTGTSARHRDAWAVGHNGGLAIGVWVGRLAGGGDPSLIGGEVALPILERLFCDGLFARRTPFPAPRSRIVARPLRFPAVTAAPLRIAHPESGGSWVALDRAAIELRPRVEGGAPPYVWFLDGRLVDATAPLHLEVGEHELRCVDSAGVTVIHPLTVHRGRPHRQEPGESARR